MVKIAVIGGGLVGSLVSCFLARKGHQVELYEMRDDPRQQEFVAGKSINLALSERGRSALRSLGLEDNVIENYAIPMRARLIHDLNGNRRAIPYGRADQCVMSVSRRYLNEMLISEVERNSNVNIHFNHKVVSADLNSAKVTFSNSKRKMKKSKNNNQDLSQERGITEKQFDTIIGCDGAHSAIRKEMHKSPSVRFDYSQRYIEHGYIELCIPPVPKKAGVAKDDEDGMDFAMEVNYLHIWPRGTFMMIALPNLDKSYTVTLFMPFTQFEAIKTSDDLLHFFNRYFPDSIELIGRDSLIETFFSTPPSPLISVKCSPYHYKDKVLLMGDAAHAMVPFYGQGMNCGFEDCLILDELLTENANSIASVLPLFSERRVSDCHAIVDLAMYNYIEMRDLVNSRIFLMRKKFDSAMNAIFPERWIPLYSMVTFSRIPYGKCIKDKRWQDEIIAKVGKWSLMGILGGVVGAVMLSGRVKTNWIGDGKMIVMFAKR